MVSTAIALRSCVFVRSVEIIGSHKNIQTQGIFEEVTILSFSILFDDQTFSKDIVSTDVYFTTKGPLGTPRSVTGRRDRSSRVVSSGCCVVSIGALCSRAVEQLAGFVLCIFDRARDAGLAS